MLINASGYLTFYTKAQNHAVLSKFYSLHNKQNSGELRLTIMASIAQEESRKLSERVKWSMRRKMEDGFAYGYSRMLGYRIENGVLAIVLEEAEIVRKMFHWYVYENKGCYSIANELNAAGYRSIKGKIWREDSVNRIIKNDKYVGDLTQWKRCCSDYLTKKIVTNHGEFPDMPLITLNNHHEAIIDRETWVVPISSSA